jgi:hypothetical protein
MGGPPLQTIKMRLRSHLEKPKLCPTTSFQRTSVTALIAAVTQWITLNGRIPTTTISRCRKGVGHRITVVWRFAPATERKPFSIRIQAHHVVVAKNVLAGLVRQRGDQNTNMHDPHRISLLNTLGTKMMLTRIVVGTHTLDWYEHGLECTGTALPTVVFTLAVWKQSVLTCRTLPRLSHSADATN